MIQKKLTLERARALVKKETGCSTANLKEAEFAAGIYEMKMGYFTITVQNDFFGSGNISLVIRHCTGGMIRKLFNPVTLEEDCDTEDTQHDKDREEIICEYGLERCKKIIERRKKNDAR